ncbi:MAG: hypothetical protein QHJ34_12355 [bacterium]|nr:hypothetical protein [bacterium]
MRRLCLVTLVLCWTLAQAATTRFAEFTTYASLEKGRLVGVTLTPRGELTLAPAVQKLADLGEPLVWSMVADRRGNLFVGTGNDGKVFRIGPNGELSLVFDAEEPEVYALAVASDGTLYMAPSPGGKILAVGPSGQVCLVVKLPCSYVWGLVADQQRTLYAATGDKAGLYRVLRSGAAELLFAPTEAHLRSLTWGSDGALLVGSSKNGYVYRVTRDGKAFTLYDSPAEEVHALALGRDGVLYAAALQESAGRPERPGAAPPAEEGQEAAEEQEVVLPPARITPTEVGRAAGGSVLAIDPDGNATELWRSDRQCVLALAVTAAGKPMAGSNDKGRLLVLERGEEATIITTVEGEQITAIVAGADDALYVATSNPGRVFRVGPAYERVGVYESEVIDARVVAQWGQLRWKTVGGADQVRLYTRSGNTKEPNETWSQWSKAYRDAAGEQIDSPPARFLQWKAELHRQSHESPAVSGVVIGYRQKNLAPEVNNVTVLPPGEYYRPPRDARDSAEEKEGDAVPTGVRSPRQLGKSEKRTGWRAVSWRFSDPNDDYLLFTISYRRVGSKNWRRLVSDLDNNFYSWDSRLMPDGEYELQIEATDAPSNVVGEALSARRISRSFVVDNTPPQVVALRWDKKAGRAIIEVHDEWSPLQRVEYALDAGPWSLLEPRDGVLDARQEVFELRVELSGGQERELVVRAVDEVGNIGFGYLTVRGE